MLRRQFCGQLARGVGALMIMGAAPSLLRGKEGDQERRTVRTALWSADHETGDLSQWYYPEFSKSRRHGGGEYNSGIAVSSASRDVAHSGRYSAKTMITTPSKATSGVRLFRWKESQDPRFFSSGLYYSAWFYFPTQYTVTGKFWNLFQFKSKHPGGVDPFWYLVVGNRSSGDMYLKLHWWDRLRIEGPHRGESGFEKFDQSLKNLPVRQWTHLECFLKQSAEFDGCLRFWQDDTELFSVSAVKTKYADGENHWSLNNYSDGLSPHVATLYIDDAVISTERVGTAAIRGNTDCG